MISGKFVDGDVKGHSFFFFFHLFMSNVYEPCVVLSVLSGQSGTAEAWRLSPHKPGICVPNIWSFRLQLKYIMVKSILT